MARRKKFNEEGQPEGADNTNDETFGLPEIEYQPLNREETTSTTTSTTETYNASSNTNEEQSKASYQESGNNEFSDDEDDDDGSVWPKILGVLAIVLLAGLAYWFFGIYQPAKRAEEKARQEQAEKDAAARKAEEERLAAERAAREAEQRRADSLANLQTKVGSIETLSERTGRYYVVISSAIDGDLLMDRAKELSEKGLNCKIIPPFGKVKFYRLAIAEGDTYDNTQSMADGMKADHGSDLWVIKY